MNECHDLLMSGNSLSAKSRNPWLARVRARALMVSSRAWEVKPMSAVAPFYIRSEPSQFETRFLRRHANGAERHTEKRDRANLGFFEHLTE